MEGMPATDAMPIAERDARTDLKGMTLPELEALFSRWGKERYRARQVFRWICQRFVEDFASMTDLSKAFREELDRSCRISAPLPEAQEVSADGTEKFLFRLEDGEGIESVLIPDAARRTLCISSQAGCPLGCAFCATGAAGFRRNLTAAEIVHQVGFAARRLAARGERLTNVVFMGMGEPLLNPREVGRVTEILISPFGFGFSGKRVTVSTAGLVPEMLEMAERYPVSFAVSLNAARDDLRARLMPVSRRHPLPDLVAAMRRIPLRRGRKVTAEYVLLAGVNDSPQDARDLARLLKGARVKVNLIPYNPHGEGEFQAPPSPVVDRFRDVLLAAGIQTITRERRGGDIRAACGQLAGAGSAPGGQKALEPREGSF